MKKKLALLVLSSGILLAAAAPSQAGATTLLPSLLDFGTFSASAPPSTVLSSTLTVPSGTKRYFSKLQMASGQPYFFPSSDCQEATELSSCHINVRVVSPVTGTGVLQGVVEVQLSEKDLGPVVESQGIAVTGTVSSSITTPPPTNSPSAHRPPKKKKCHSKKAKAKKKKKCGKR